MIQRIVRKSLVGLIFLLFLRIFFVPILTSGGLAAVSSSAFAALYSAFGKYDVVHIHAEGPAFFGMAAEDVWEKSCCYRPWH